jgi:hypothetical protein
MVKVFFERGAFISATTLSVSLLIPIVMINDVFFRMVNNMIGRTFFVLKDTLTANLVSSITIFFYFWVAKSLIEIWGYWGLALAQPIQAGLAVMVMSWLLIRRIKEFSGLYILKNLFLYGSISLAAAIPGWVIVQLFSQYSLFIQLGCGVIIPVTIYLGLLYVFDRPIAKSIFEMIGVLKVFTSIKTRIIPVSETPPV